MSYNNVNQQFGPRVPPGAESIPKTAATDFQTGQATGTLPLPAYFVFS